MNKSFLIVLATTGLVAVNTAHAQELPTAPLGGEPAAGTEVSVDDFAYQLAYQRSFEAVLWSMPLITNYGFHQGAKALGAEDNTILAFSGPATPLFEALTPNNATPYIISQANLQKGPVVLKIPAATDKASLFGQIVDHQFFTIGDIGPIGVDKGQGATLLITPPDYDGAIPTEYTEVKSGSFRIDLVFRSIPTPDGTDSDAYALARMLEMYFLSEEPDPEPTKFIDPIGMRMPTLPRYDERWFEDLHAIVSVENPQPRDKVMLGLLKTLGIEKGKPFDPDETTKKAMRQAAIDAYAYMQVEMAKVRDGELWWDNRRWRNVFFHDANKGFQWETDALLDYDTRATRPWFSATYFPSKVADKPPTMYIATMRDADGDILQAGETYSLTVPKGVPIEQFWSLTIYDQATWAFIYSPEMLPGLSSRDKLNQNADGSVTLYFGPEAPRGLKSNWIPTSGKAPYAMFRFYGPTDAFYDKSFVLPDIELVK